MLALYLQFSRLDDVIHFPLKAPTLPHPFWGMEEKSAEFVQILWAPGAAGHPTVARCVLQLSISGAGRSHNSIRLRCWLLNLQSRAPSYLNPTGIEE
jgi:hypothetical protein